MQEQHGHTTCLNKTRGQKLWFYSLGCLKIKYSNRVTNIVVICKRGNQMSWDKMATEKKATIIIMTIVGLILVCVSNLICLGIL